MKAFEALADPTRRQIVEMVARRELSAGEIAAAFDVSRPAVSRHLRVLRQSGLLTSRGDKQRRIYRIDPAVLDQMEAWIIRTRRFWTDRLDALERQLEERQ